MLHTVEERLADAVASLDEAQPSPLLALEALLPERRRQLFEACCWSSVCWWSVCRLIPVASSLWSGQQPLLRQRALQQLVGAYTQLPREGAWCISVMPWSPAVTCSKKILSSPTCCPACWP